MSAISNGHGEVETAPLHEQLRRRAVGHGRFDGGAGGDTASATTREPGRARLLVGASRQSPDARRPRRSCVDCWHSDWEVSGASGRWLEGSASYRSAACSAGPEAPAAASPRPAPQSSSDSTFALIGRASVTRSSWTPRRRATSQRKSRSSARRARRWATLEYELDEPVALGGLAVDAILRDDGKRGVAVAPSVTCLCVWRAARHARFPRPAIRSAVRKAPEERSYR